MFLLAIVITVKWKNHSCAIVNLGTWTFSDGLHYYALLKLFYQISFRSDYLLSVFYLQKEFCYSSYFVVVSKKDLSLMSSVNFK